MYHDKQMVVTPDWTRLMIRLMSAKFHIHAYIFFHMNNYILCKYMSMFCVTNIKELIYTCNYYYYLF